jgi:anaerobic dimethyl sulfoxide reductase subunit B (iron-sulfur subunit)
MTQYGFYLDINRCIGCKTCEIACKDYHELGPEILYRRIYDYEGGTWNDNGDGTWTTDAFVYHITLSCNHCDNPACVAACPTGAMQKDEETGLVFTDRNVCIGCMQCRSACPYDAPRLNEELGICRKCDGCIARVKNGRQPICVESCPMRALEFDDIEVLREKHGDLAQVTPMADSSMTNPNIVLRAPDLCLDNAEAMENVELKNPTEVE